MRILEIELFGCKNQYTVLHLYIHMNYDKHTFVNIFILQDLINISIIHIKVAAVSYMCISSAF